MIHCFFKFPWIEGNGIDDCWYGYAAAEDGFGLFEAIDSYGDPFSCVVARVDCCASYCFKAVRDDDGVIEYEDHEFSSHQFDVIEDNEWIEPIVTPDHQVILPWVGNE